MSYILDALKRESQALPAYDNDTDPVHFAQPAQVYAEAGRPMWPWITSAVLFVLTVVVVVVVVLIGQSEPEVSIIARSQPPVPVEKPSVVVLSKRPQPVIANASGDLVWPPKGVRAKAASRSEADATLPRPVTTVDLSKSNNSDLGEPIEFAEGKPVKKPKPRPAAVKAEPKAEDTQISSDALLASFEAAVRATEASGDGEPVRLDHPSVEPLMNFPKAYQDAVPDVSFSQHNYSSDPAKRWVKVNNAEVREGEPIAPGVTLIRIDPQQVVMEMQDQQFYLPALADW